MTLMNYDTREESDLGLLVDEAKNANLANYIDGRESPLNGYSTLLFCSLSSPW